MSEQATGTGIGQPVRRREDLRFITGKGRYTDDLNLPGQAYAAMLRSPYAHAVIRSIDASAARGVPGVIAVLTGNDWIADGMKALPNKTFSWHPAEMPLVNSDGSAPYNAPDFPLPHDKARFVGEPLVMVVAETVAEAKDGVEQVVIDFEPLPCVIYAPDAVSEDAPVLYDKHGSNVCIDANVGDAAATAAAFARARHIARIRTWVPRIAGSPMEPRAAVGDYDSGTGSFTLYTTSQNPHVARLVQIGRAHV